MRVRLRPHSELGKSSPRPQFTFSLSSILIVSSYHRLDFRRDLVPSVFRTKIFMKSTMYGAPNYAVSSSLLKFSLTWVHVDFLSPVLNTLTEYMIFRLGGRPHIQVARNNGVISSVSIEWATGMLGSVTPRFHTPTHTDTLAVQYCFSESTESCSPRPHVFPCHIFWKCDVSH
jgi:hypothetical protein